MNAINSVQKAPILLLALTVALTPFSIDAYLPALPTIAKEFDTSIHYIELSISFFLVGYALGQVIGGPISDSMGRRKSVFLGLTLFCLGTVAVIFSNSPEVLWLSRFIQAIGGGLTGVNPAAIIRDISSGREAAKNLGKVVIIMMIAPLIAPVIGSAILTFSNWHTIFVFLLIYALSIFIAIFVRLPETRRLPDATEHVKKENPLQKYLYVLKNTYAMGYVFANCCSYAGLFAYVTTASFIYIEYFNFSKEIFPVFFAINVATLAMFNRVNVFLLNYYNPHQLLTAGQTALLLVSISIFSYCYLTSEPSPWVFLPLLASYCAALGLISSNATVSTIEYFPNHAATATAFIGANSFLWGAGSGFVYAYFADGSLVPIAAVFLGASVLGICLKNLLQLKGTPSIS